MYPDGGGDDLGAGFGGGDLKSKIMSNFEGFIPLILIIIIAFFLLTKFNVINEGTPFVGPLAGIITTGDQPKEILIIGQPSPDVLDILNTQRDRWRYVLRTADQLDRNPADQLSQYDLVFFDQSNMSTKEVTSQFGQALEDWVKKGGKVIMVKNSGIKRPQTYDVIGWKATFGDIMPVGCERTINNIPNCDDKAALNVVGQVWAQKRDHPIMKGIEIAPAEGSLILSLFEIDQKGTLVAYIKDASGKTYPGILEKSNFIGKVVYFNYDPGKTRGIFENTLNYLR